MVRRALSLQSAKGPLRLETVILYSMITKIINEVHELVTWSLPTLRKIPSMRRLILPLRLLWRRSPNPCAADDCVWRIIRIPRVDLNIDRHHAVVCHRPRGSATSARLFVRGFAVGCYRSLPEQDILIRIRNTPATGDPC